MDRPLVTFALFSYNQRQFIRKAVRAALAQTYSPLEIVFSDDCSEDGTFEIIQEEVATYSGPHKVVLNSNGHNLGMGEHVNHVMELASGELIVAAAGDDISLPTRTEELVRAWSKGENFSVYSNAVIIDEDGRSKGTFTNHGAEPIRSWKEMIRSGMGVFGCAHAWDRAVFDIFGPLPKGIVSEDLTISFRSALLGRVAYLDKCLVQYRRHGANISKDANHIFQMDLSQFISWEVINARTERVHYESWLRDALLLISSCSEARPEGLRAAEGARSRIELCDLVASVEDRHKWDRIRNCLRVVKYAGNIGIKQVMKASIFAVSPMLYFNIRRWRLKLRNNLSRA